MKDLTSAAAERFNREVPDHRSVHYYSVVATIADPAVAHPLLKPLHHLLKSLIGENDGVVPAASQEWGQVLERVDSDHWGEIGWSKAYDPAPLYLRLSTRLRRSGG